MHFRDLRQRRSAAAQDRPLFALEHGLDACQVAELSAGIRAEIARRRPSTAHALPWIVYAAELGYGYSGDEYWQTFERQTPGWVQHGERGWLRDRFVGFQREFGGAEPTGRWAEHFSIICWPIAHAILPRDLQRQLAKVLYELRHSFTAELLATPGTLGARIATRTWGTSSRFKDLAHQPELLGQVASALLLHTEAKSDSLILAATLKRIAADLEDERVARQWLKDARAKARERLSLHGLARPGPVSPRAGHDVQRARQDVEALAIEPRLILRPTEPDRSVWEVQLDIPDLSHLPARFPTLRAVLESSRCTVAGAAGRPLARGRVMGGTRVILARWPKQEEPLLQFDNSPSELALLLSTECLLRSPPWLFRIASDGLAYELRGRCIRAGESYVLVTSAPLAHAPPGAIRVRLLCDGVAATLFTVPDALDSAWESAARRLQLAPAKTIRVWPVGLPPAQWDGEGRGEWLVGERARIAMCADHALRDISVSVDVERLDIDAAAPGATIFIELPPLPLGVHRVHVRARAGDEEAEGELQAVAREPRAWDPASGDTGPLGVELEPPSATLEQLWDGVAEVGLSGPAGREVVCTVTLRAGGADTEALVSKRLPPLRLPVQPADWRAQFARCFQGVHSTQEEYDAARACDIEFSADELGSVRVHIEREYAPLRWNISRDGHQYVLQLSNETSDAAPPRVGRIACEAPDVEEHLDSVPRFAVPASGGLYVARKGEFCTAVVVAPAVRGLDGLRCSPRLQARPRSPGGVLMTLRYVALWGAARPAGTLLATARRHDVLRAFTEQLSSLIGGDRWARAERVVVASRAAQEELHRHISEGDERAFSAFVAAQQPRVAGMTLEQRVALLADGAHRLLRLPELRTTAVEVGGGIRVQRRRDNPEHPSWLSEFALRMASDPATVPSWAGQHTERGLKNLLAVPALFRGARYMVLTMSGGAVPGSGMTCLYPGWRWS